MNPNPAIISATIAVVTIVFAIFGASWLNQRNIENLLDQLGKRFDARFDTVLTEIKRLDQRIDSVERGLSQRIDSVELSLNQRIDYVDQRIDSVDRRLDRIERQLEAVFKPAPPVRG